MPRSPPETSPKGVATVEKPPPFPMQTLSPCFNNSPLPQDRHTFPSLLPTKHTFPSTHLLEQQIRSVHNGLGQVDLVGHVADLPEGIDEGAIWTAHLSHTHTKHSENLTKLKQKYIYKTHFYPVKTLKTR